MKKLEKGETVTWFKCCKEGHKSYQCKEKEGEAKGKENSKPKNLNKSKKGHKKAKEIKKNTSLNLKASYIYTKPTHKNKQKSNQYILEKKKNGKGGSSCHGVENIWMEPAYLGAQGYYSYHGWLSKGLDP